MSDQSTDFKEILELGKVAEQILNGKEYFVGSLADRLASAAKVYPHDQAIRSMHRILSNKFAENSLATMNQREFQDVYNELSSLGNSENFKDELGDLLYDDPVAPVTTYKTSQTGDEPIALANQDLVKEYNQIFDAHDPSYVSSYIENGRSGIQMELDSMGLDHVSVSVAAKDNNFVIFSADVTTTEGRASFLIPAEIKSKAVLLPSVFVAGGEFVDFNKSNIVSYAAQAKNLKLSSPNSVLQTLNKLAGIAPVTYSGDAFDSVQLESPGLYSEMVSESEQDLPIDAVHIAEMPSELKGLSDSLISETLVEAGVSFGRDLVVKAKQMLESELSGLGVSFDKITVASEWDSGINFATNIVTKSGKKTIQMPVEIIGQAVLMPSSFTSGPIVKAFNEKDLHAFAYSENNGDYQAVFSDKSSYAYNDLYADTLKKAAMGNFIEVEENLMVIADRFGPELHKIAFNDLTELMSMRYSEKEEVDDLEKYIKEASEKAKLQEDTIKLSNKLLYLYGEDER